jgi:ABC-2 type transport system ATP-binding protein
MSAEPAIRFDAVGVRFGAITALAKVNLRVASGSLCALCGPNGAGKSTTIKLVCGLLAPTTGHGSVLGESLTARPARRRAAIGYMAQHTVLYDELSVTENLRFRAGAMGLANAARHAAETLRAHRLGDVADQRVGRLSGGWRQRVAFAVARLASPRLLLLDEPSAGLDAAARGMLWAELRTLADAGTTLLVSTHDAAEAALCDALVVLEHGRVVFTGTPADRWSTRQLLSLRTAAAIGMETYEDAS